MSEIAHKKPILAIIPRARVQNRVFLGFVILHFLAAILVGKWSDAAFHTGMQQTLAMLFSILLPLFLVVIVLWHFAVLAIFVRPKRPSARFISDVRSVVFDADRMLNGLVALLGVTLFIGTFSYFKSIVPFLKPFQWDSAFAEADRWLHFGLDPYRLLQPVFGSPWATTALNAIYHFWFFLVYFVVFVACFSSHSSTVSRQYLIAFGLVFALGGNALAVVFSSAGPVYFERLGLGADFVPLTTMLQQFNTVAPVWALDVQEALWNSHTNGGPISGISAMPSMHVASSTLMAIAGFGYRKWAGYALTGFAIAIMIGSVQLGWHYAIDGYLGAALAVICWKLAAPFVSRGKSPQSL